MKNWKKSGRSRKGLVARQPRRLRLPGFRTPKPPRVVIVHPSETEWAEMTARAAKRRKGVAGLVKIVTDAGYVQSGDPKDRQSWRLPDAE